MVLIHCRLPAQLAAVVLVIALPLTAQHKPVEVRGTVGYATFLDEGDESHFAAGGSVRQYITSRLSIEPEFLYLYKDRSDKDIVIQPNLAFDFGPAGAKVQPYVIGGAGLLREIRPRFSTNSWTFSGGAGVKIWLSPRWYIAPEGRLGSEPILRLHVSVGYRF